MMEKYALLARVKAKAGKESEVEQFLMDALPLAEDEPDTVSWYSWRIDNNTFGIFDTFPHEEGRDAHLSGAIASALMENAPHLLAEEPVIEKLSILAAK